MLKPYEKYQNTEYDWLGLIPLHWQWLYLSQTCTEKKQIKNTGNIEKKVLSLSYGKIVSRKNVDLGLAPKDYSSYQIVDKNDIILRLTDLQNDKKSLRTGLVKERGIITSAYTCLKPFQNAAYLQYLLHSYDTQKVFYGMGGGVRQSIGYKDIRNIRIPFPPREEQDQIVRFLDWKLAKINKLIRAKKKQIALFNEQRQAIINNVVTKGLDSHAKLKESGISGLGSIPSTWSVKPLKYWAKSNLQSLNSSTEADFEFDYLDISSVGFGYVKQEPVHYRFDEAPSRARRVVKYGDTIISTVRTYLRSMCFIDHDIEHCIVSTGFSVLSPIKGTVLPEILSYALSSDYFVNEVIKNSIGVSYPAINNKKLLSLKVALPSTIEEQLQLYNEIKTKTTLLDKGILSIKQQVTTLKEFRTRLISDVVTGKVDVRDIEIPEYEADSDETIDDEIDDNLVLDEEDGEMEVE